MASTAFEHAQKAPTPSAPARSLLRRLEDRLGFLSRQIRLFFTVQVFERFVIRRAARNFYLLIGGHIHFQSLSAAVQFDLFTLLERGGGLSLLEICAALGIEEQPAQILMLSLVSTGLVKKRRGKYANSWVARHHLSRTSPKNIADIILWQHFINYRPMYHLFESLKANKNVGLEVFDGNEPTLYERLVHHPELEQVFQSAMTQISVQANDLFAQFADLGGVKSLLDVGGGHGSNIIQLAERYPEINAAVFDFPSVCAAAQENILQHGLSSRLGARHGNCFLDSFPEGYDCILFCHFFTIWSKAKNLQLLKKAFASLPEGGRVMIFNMMQFNDRSGPLSATLGSPYFLTLATGEGMLYTWSEYEELFREAGFCNIRRQALPKDHGLIVGFKPVTGQRSPAIEAPALEATDPLRAAEPRPVRGMARGSVR